MDREIWFKKVLWSYQPCNATGFAVMLAVILPPALAISLSLSALDAIGYQCFD